MNQNKLSRHFPNASPTFLKLNSDQVNGGGEIAKLECPYVNAPLDAPQVKAPGSGRYVVCVTSVRKRLLDEDNLAEKFHIDALRYAGLISGDSPDKTKILTSQRKCEKDEKEHIEITITYL